MTNELKDTQDRTWRLAVTIDSVMSFEKMTDIQVFAKLFELWKKHRDNGDELEIMLAMAADLFPGMKEAAAFTYSCATIDGDQKKPAFDEFCRSVGPIECGIAVVGLTQKLREFMPQDDDGVKRREGADGSRPLGR